jgi:hypothetical protein
MLWFPFIEYRLRVGLLVISQQLTGGIECFLGPLDIPVVASQFRKIM